MAMDFWVYGCRSEWALAKLFSVIFDEPIRDYFKLAGVSEIDESKDIAIKKLNEEIVKRKSELEKGHVWRRTNVTAEIESAQNLEAMLKNGLGYIPASNGSLKSLSKDSDSENFRVAAAAIFTKNTTHIDYLEELFNRGIHLLCEKPMVCVTDKYHRADREQLDKLENICGNLEFYVKCADHYLAKNATKIFFNRLNEMVKEYGLISKIEACTKEVDNPDKPRTKKLLSIENRTGLLLDMGVHLFGVITSMGGEIGKITEAKYDRYGRHNGQGAYDVETYVDVGFKVGGELFHKDVDGRFLIVKFIDRLKELENDDKKEFKVTFKKDHENGKSEECVVTIDFLHGKVYNSEGRDKGKRWKHEGIYPEEYKNILEDFYNLILNGQKDPKSVLRDTINGLNAIFRTYKEFPVEKNLIEVYR